VSLEEAREDKKIAQDLNNSLNYDKNITPVEKNSIKAPIKEETRTYYKGILKKIPLTSIRKKYEKYLEIKELKKAIKLSNDN
jgi:hypothetical protein